MQISAYQIHNVLNAYSLRYYKLINEALQTDDENANNVDIRMSPQEKRHHIIEKVASDIISRITSLDSLSDRQSSVSDLQQESDNTERVLIRTEPRPNDFAFNCLDTENVKTFKTISIEDSIFMIKQDLKNI